MPSTLTPARRASLTARQSRAAYFFIVPFLVVFVGMLVVPLGYSAIVSLFQHRLVGGTEFAGLDNYVRAFSDPRFLGGLLRMGLFLVIQVPVMLVIALALALALDSGRLFGHRALRLIAFVPYAVPGVVATLMWGYLYGRDFGPIAQIATSLGLRAPELLADDTVLGSMMNIVSWEYIGYNMLIMYAALRSIPSELFEAARVDGAGPFRIAWSIKIPAIRPAIFLTVIFSVIGTFQLFNEPALLHSIAPNVITGSFTPNFYAYNLAFVNQDVNYAASVAFVLGLVIAVLSFVVQGAERRREAGNR